MIRVLSGTVSGFVPPYLASRVNCVFVHDYVMHYYTQSELHQGGLTKHGERSLRHYSVDGYLYNAPSDYVVWPDGVKYEFQYHLPESKYLDRYEYWSIYPGPPPVSLWVAGPPPSDCTITQWGFCCSIQKNKSSGSILCHYNALWYIAANKQYFYHQTFQLNSPFWYPHEIPTQKQVEEELLNNRYSSSTFRDWHSLGRNRCVSVTLKPIRHIPDFLGYARYRRVLDNTPDIREQRRYLLSDLSQDIADHANDLTINSIAYAKEFCEYIVGLAKLLSGDVSSITRAIGSGPVTKKAVIRGLADAELSASYGLSLTIADTKELYSHFVRSIESYEYGISRAQKSLSYSRGDVSYTEHHYCKTWYRRSCDGFQGLLNELFKEDAFLSLQNVWDLIPYSFVIDWVFPIEQYLNQQDANTRLSVLPISEVLYTTKVEISFSPNAVKQLTAGLGGQINVTLYERDANASLPPIYPHFQGRDQFQSWLQAGALITQKILK